MGISVSSHLLFLQILLFSALLTLAFALKKPYIVYLGSHSHGLNPTSADTDAATNSHYSLLGSLLGSTEKAQESMFYSYTNTINGFAALLDEDEVEKMAEHPQVVSVFLSKGRKLHTTRSWEFMRLEREDGKIPLQSIWRKARFGEDTIIANLDTGVWPESKSFSDERLGPIPAKWRGICYSNSTDNFQCNRKLIGARYFSKGYAAYAGKAMAFNSVRDVEGHGTHTLSTAGGSFVEGANVFGHGNGTAKGGSPRARVVAYKVCGPEVDGHECFDADILAGFDAAIGDGVDVISMSLGGEPAEFFEDGIAIGSFHAVKSGIVVVSSAGNSGPSPSTVSNGSPWMITVAASTIDREFASYVSIGPNKHFEGSSLSAKPLPEEKFYPVIRSADAKLANVLAADADLCKQYTLDPKKVSGKILLCLRGDNARTEKGQNAAFAGAVGMVLANDEANGNDITADPHVLPASHITYKAGLTLYAYMNSTKAPMAYMTAVKTLLGTKPAPYITSFSSRGPSLIEPGILKPDLTAPGSNIIAAFPETASPTDQPLDKRHTPFITMSGTSMSCPHVAGVVGLLKTMYPNWSPAAIKSAIMTTARGRDNNNETMLDASFVRATPFAYGSGHIRPNRAMDPGLVYDLSANDYANFLCARGYNSSQIALFTNRTYTCPKGARVEDLNYPSITALLEDGGTTVSRRLKNVGPPGTYTARVKSPPGVSVTVTPTVLKFEDAGDEKEFRVSLKPNVPGTPTDYVFGDLVWSDGKKHIVRSPITVMHK